MDFRFRPFSADNTYYEILPSLFIALSCLFHSQSHAASIYCLIARYNNDIRTWPAETRSSLVLMSTINVHVYSSQEKQSPFMPYCRC